MSGPHETVNRHSGMVCCACSCFIYFTKRISWRTLIRFLACRAAIPCLSLWERWPSEERGRSGFTLTAAKPSPSPAVTALPKGAPRGCAPFHRMLAGKMERIGSDTPHSLMTTHQIPAGVLSFPAPGPGLACSGGLPCDRMGLYQIPVSARRNAWRSNCSVRRKGAASR